MPSATIGFALCGSFCTFKAALGSAKALLDEGYRLIPIFSDTAYATDTRFGKAKDWVDAFETLMGSKSIHSIVQAEPIGPKALFDLMLIAPCTGNTLSKLTYGMVDTSVTMGAKSHLRNGRSLLIAPSTNDALGNAAKNIGTMLNYRNIYFVPMKQDDPENKPRSMVADFGQIPLAVKLALEGKQIQPVF